MAVRLTHHLQFGIARTIAVVSSGRTVHSLRFRRVVIPRQSDRFIIDNPLSQLIELEILDADSSSSSDSDLELFDMLSSDSTSTDSSGDSDRDLDFDEDGETDRDEDVEDLVTLADAVEQSRYLTRGLRWDKSDDFLYRFFLDLPDGHFHQVTRMARASFFFNCRAH
ncbi:hypothetical protein R1sor_027158 [Riccia sorocarpa]|uniref:Uncharacterized protein n=1 Tax=Riccia sorocarpa TaxID=122646 RepID=A0ABD3GGK6_9MARC